jgi:mycofactocin glycosyltransferase
VSARSSSPFVSVVVPARNSERTIGACLSSLERVDYPQHRREILAVDNGSTDRTTEIIRGHPVTYLYEPRKGPSSARNRGIEASRGAILAFVDADCVASRGWLIELVRGFEDPEIWGVAGEVAAWDPETPAERYVAQRRPRLQQGVLARSRPYAGGANVAFRRQTFEAIGLFDPALPMGGDKDFGWRFSDAGLKLGYCPRALVLHRHRTTAWGLFSQCAGWGYGHALVHRKHRPPWSVRRELPDVGIAAALRDLVKGAAGYATRRGDAMSAWYPYLDLLRRVGLRLGAFYGTATRS